MSLRTMERRVAMREVVPVTQPDEPNASPTAGGSDRRAEPELKAAARPDGIGYRAIIITEDGRAVWACAHVHFTEHSAKADAEQQLNAMHARTASSL